MDTMGRYKIQGSIKDVIAILDSAPMRRDLMLEANAVQLTNRAPMAHLAVERGLKALITEAGTTPELTHSLNKLYRDLSKCNAKSADYLAKAFEDAVKFFRYDVNTNGFGHLRSLDDYLSKTGTEGAFEALRYWVIEESSKGANPIPYILLSVHRELLWALWCLFLPNRRDTVSDRVEREVAHAMFGGRHIVYRADDTRKEQSVHWYMNWLSREHATRCNALKEAVHRDFAIKDDEFVTQTLRDAYKDLQESKDPAVRYYIRTLSYLPVGSQRPNPDATPEVEWFGKDRTSGMVVTPAGTRLGLIEKYADGGWGMMPEEPGLVRVSEVAWALADAKHYLVNRLTNPVTVAVNGESKQLRIISERNFFAPPVWTPDIEDFADLNSYASTYELEFWNGEHGLSPGDGVLIKLQSEGSQGFAWLLEGTVIEVVAQRVSITGTVTLRSTEAVES